MPTTHRDQNYHRKQTLDDNAIIVPAEGVDLEARSDPAVAAPDAGWLRLRSRDGYLAERRAAGGGVQAAEHMAARPPSGGLFCGAGNLQFLGGAPARGLVYADHLYAVPFVLPFSLQIDAVVYRLTTADAGKFIRFGLYDVVPGGILPRNLIESFGPDELVIAGTHTFTYETTLNPGYYFWCFNTDSAAAKLHVVDLAGMTHALGVTTTFTLYTRLYYALAYAAGLPDVWAENDEAYTYEVGSPYAFGVRVA